MSIISNNFLSSKITRTRHIQERSVPKFLKKIFSFLEEDQFNEYVSWNENGSAMIIKKPTDFANKVLPMFFKHNNFSSFIRQLNMYQFKKSKNPRYDHIYSHRMFQSGKVDLLRNITRKNVEMPNMTSSSSQSIAADDEIDVEGLIRENMTYKKIHTELLTQVSFIENKMHAVKSEVAKLYEEKKKSETNEKFLKSVLKSLTKVYGFENISKIIANDVEDVEEAPVSVQKVSQQEECFEMFSNTNNKSSSQMVESSYGEDALQERYSQYSPEEQSSEHLSTNDAPQGYENIQFNLIKSNPLFMVDFGLNNKFTGNDAEYEDSPILSKINSYGMWNNELKNDEWNPEKQFCHSAMRFMGDLNVENF
jgi:hypothetical protein